MQWINVKDRLPDQFNTVILYDASKRSVVYGYKSKGDFKQDGYGNMEDYTFINVTHWMPLPEQPDAD